VIERFNDCGAHDAREVIEIDDHAGHGTLGVERPIDGDVDTIRVSVQPRAFSGVMREHVCRFESELFADLHDMRFSVFRRTRPSMIATNRKRLVVMPVHGEVAAPSVPSAIYDIGHDGVARTLPSVGGISLNVRVGDNAFFFAGDHVEPGVSTRHPDNGVNVGYCVYASVGNTATVLSGEAKGERGTVTGKHGGIEHVMIDFAPEIMERMALGDKIAIRSVGLGMELEDPGDVRVFNCDPDFVEKLSIERKGDELHVPVARLVPAAIMGSGLGRATVARGDYDIQCFDPVMVEKYGLNELRYGDIVAIVDADHSYGRIYRTGAVSIGIVAHGSSDIAGHGPGVTSLLTSPSGALVPHMDSGANIASILNLR
jgi:hypothetical protein